MESGAAGLLLMPPYFFRYTQEEILAFYRSFAAQARVRVPVLLYHIPIFTNPIAVETAALLISEGPYSGIKDSSGDWDNFIALNNARSQKQFGIMMGNDSFFVRSQEFAADGVISGIASALPELLVGLKRAVASNQPEVVTRLDVRLQQFISWLPKFPVPVGVKEAVALRGIKVTGNSIPLTGDQIRLLEEFRSWFRDWLPQVQKECSHA
jgi:4-hydroxy-tetrahydrodipicolinate synthase